jgi:hypothetical protein
MMAQYFSIQEACRLANHQLPIIWQLASVNRQNAQTSSRIFVQSASRQRAVCAIMSIQGKERKEPIDNDEGGIDSSSNDDGR